VRNEKPIPQAWLEGIAFVICSDQQDRKAASSRRNPSQDVTMRVVHVKDIKVFTTKIVTDVKNIPKMSPQELGIINPDGMVQTKLVRCLHPCKANPSLYAVLERERRFLIGQGDIMPSFF
jgi:hypothetical protein